MEAFGILRVRPDRPDMVRCELYPHARFTVHAHHVPVVLGVDGAAQDLRPERALGREFGGVEDNDLMTNPHVAITIP